MIPAAVPTAVRAALRRPGSDRQNTTIAKREISTCRQAGSVLSTIWAMLMHTHRSWTISAPSWLEGRGAQEVCEGL